MKKMITTLMIVFFASLSWSDVLYSQDNILTYAGNSGREVFYDVVALSDGTFLVSGAADNLNWISATKVKLTSTGITNPSPQNKYAFIIRLSSNLSSVLHCVYLDLGVADDIKYIKFTNAPGSTTGSIFISGNVSDGYFLGKLNNNFINGNPTGFAYVKNIAASGYPKTYHPWDVTNDGKVFYVTGESHGYNWASAHCLDASGNMMVVSNWRTHWLKAGGEAYGTLSSLGIPSSDVSHSGIVFKFWGRGDLRSWTQADYTAVEADGNGGTRQGKWPMDVLFNSPWDPVNKPTSGPGYTGYKPSGTPVYGVSAVVVDKRTNNVFFGMNTKSVLPDGNPDFEPAVFAMSSTGSLLWWSRLYHEITPTGEIHNSTPDQYIDYLAVDYSAAASSSNLVVLARCHGNNIENYWKGNKVNSNSSANGFQNQFTGSVGNIHISYLCKLALSNGTLKASTYVAEYQDDMAGTSGSHSDPNLDGWPSPNSGWPNVNTTRCTDLEVSSDGNIIICGTGRRTITTANAYQKMVKKAEGSSCWNYFVREYKPDLSVPLYSSLIVGNWDKTTGAGGSNTEIYSVIKTGTKIIAVGRQTASTDGVPNGNPIPVTNVPSWGNSSPNNESCILAGFNSGSGTTPNNPPSVSITQPANNSTFTAGSNITINATASDSDGSVSKVEFFRGSTKLGEDAGSPYSYTWSNVSAGTYQLTAKATDDKGATTTSSVINITVQAAGTLPSPWLTSDIGAVAASGSASYSSEQFTVAGSGADIWGSADEFRFVYQSISGNGEIIAKVESQTNSNSWAKSGVMIRESLNANSTHAFTAITPGNGVNFQRRTSTGGTSAGTKISGKTVPIWVKISRDGNTFTSAWSSDGTSWTTIGTASVTMAATVYVGMAVTSHSDGNLCTTVFSNVSVNTGSTNQLPTVSITSPSNNSAFTEGESVSITASASDSDGSIAKVEFYRGTTKLGEDNTSPYSYTWTNTTEGTYSLTAKATDNAGGITTSSQVNVIINPVTSFSAKINFQPAGSVPSGFLSDEGLVYGSRGNGYSYGWNAANNNTRIRNVSGLSLEDRTLNHMQKGGTFTWQIEVPNGYYIVSLLAGDASYTDQVNTMKVENVTLTDPDGNDNFDQYNNISVQVSDGKLTLAPTGGTNAKICWIEINTDNTKSATDIEDPVAANETGVKVFPNPVADYLTIQLDESTNARAELYNYAGTQVLNKEIKGGTAIIPVDNCIPGVYILRICSDELIQNFKIVIE